MEIGGIAAFVAAGLLFISLLVKGPDTQRNLRYAAAACLLAAAVWIAFVMAPNAL